MSNNIAHKLKIKEGFALRTLNAPDDFKRMLEPLPAAVEISDKTKNFNQVHWYVSNRTQMEKQLPIVLRLVKQDVLCWIYYPKQSSNKQIDLTRDKGWDELLKHKELHWITLISIDETWSAFAFRLKKENDIKKDIKTTRRAIADYIDVEKKAVILPADFESLLKRNGKAAAFYQSLSFTNKKEYVEWIVMAKKEETRNRRMSESMERLQKGWKNPRNL